MYINKGFKFLILPNEDQSVLIEKTFGSTRLVYNYYLGIQKQRLKENKRRLSYKKTTKAMRKLKKDEKPFLGEVDSTALQRSLKHLDKAYNNHFRNPAKFDEPKFKSKKTSKKSYTSVMVNNNIRIEGNFVILPKLGKVRIKLHRQLPKGAVIKSATVSKSAKGQYYASLTCEYQKDVPKRNLNKENSVGLDFAMNGLYVDSNGASANHTRYYRESEKKLQKEQRKLSKCEKFSKNYNKQKRKVAKLHERIANQRKDFLQKLSTKIANEVDIVCIEDLDMKGMSKGLKFGKSVHDNGWGMFIRMLEYKLNEQGKELQKVGRWYPSSKTCHACGCKLERLELKERKWVCPECGVEHERDKNAAINILKEGLRLLSENKEIEFA